MGDQGEAQPALGISDQPGCKSTCPAWPESSPRELSRGRRQGDQCLLAQLAVPGPRVVQRGALTLWAGVRNPREPRAHTGAARILILYLSAAPPGYRLTQLHLLQAEPCSHSTSTG